MDPNNNTIHVIYFVPLSTNPNKSVEYEATIVILFKLLATTRLPTAVAVHFHVLVHFKIRNAWNLANFHFGRAQPEV